MSLNSGPGSFIYSTPAGRHDGGLARVAAGVPTGGQFTATARSESDVGLDLDQPTNPLSGLDDDDFVRHLRRNLMPYAEDLHGSFTRSRRMLDVHPTAAAEMLAELRARRAVDFPELDGYEERSRLYAEATGRLFGRTSADLGEPLDAAEALGFVHGHSLRVDTDRPANANIEAALRIAEIHPEVAEAVIDQFERARQHRLDADVYRPLPGIVEQTMLRFAASPMSDVRILAARHARGDSPALDVLSRDPEPSVRLAVAERIQDIYNRRSVPQVHRSKFSLDLDRYERTWVKDGAVKRDKVGRDTVAMLDSLAVDPDTGVRRAVARSRHFSSRKALHALATDRDPMVRRVLVEGIADKDVDADVLDTLSRDPERGIREALADSGAVLPPKAAARLSTPTSPQEPGAPAEFDVIDGQIVRRPVGG